MAALLGPFAAPAEARSTDRRLNEARAKIQQVRAEIERTRERRRQDAEALGEAERQLAVVIQAVHEAEAAVQRQEHAVAEARRQLEELEAREEHQRELIGDRAAAIYMQAGGQEFSALLAAENPSDAVRRSLYMDIVTRADRGAFETIGIARVAVDAQRRTLEFEEAALQQALDEQQLILADVRALRNDRALRLADSENRLRTLQAEERHLEAERSQLAALSRRSARASGASRSGGGAAVPVVSAGGWSWPVRGGVTSEFGRRWGRIHEGLDIGAGSGTAVGAARDGRVSYTGRMGGYGNLVLVDHGGGVVTAYAHLSQISVSGGQSVSAGQRIGAVGCTGSCTGPHLHFEVRVGGVARNPRGYLP